jgi:membrane associated rhomboid family serine protease
MLLPGAIGVGLGLLLLLDPQYPKEDAWRFVMLLTLVGIAGPFLLFGLVARPLPDQWIEVRERRLRLPPSAFTDAPLEVAMEDVHSIYARLERDGMLWIETSVRTFMFPLRLFESPSTAALLVQCVRDRIRELPDGARRIERIDRDMRIAEGRSRAARVTFAAIGLLGAGAVIAALAGPETKFGLVRIGANVGFLVREGEVYRLVASLFLHDRLQLAFAVAGLGLAGSMLERLLGAASTAIVMMTAGLAGAAAAQVGGVLLTYGSTPVVFGLMGAAAYITHQHRDRIPVLLRPSLASWVMLGAFTVPMAMFEPVDFGSNMGGLLAGLVTGAVLAGDGSDLGRSRAPWAIAALLGLVYAGGLGWAASALDGYPRSVTVRVIDRYLREDDADHRDLNRVAWELAIDPDAGPDELRLAEVAARRGVDRSPDGEAPAIEDTLATVLYRTGRFADAVALEKKAFARSSSLASQLARFLRAEGSEIGRARYEGGQLALREAPAAGGAFYGVVLRGGDLAGLVTFSAKAGERAVEVDAPWMEGLEVVLASVDEGRTISAKAYEMSEVVRAYP